MAAEDVWSRTGLGRREHRFVTIPCVSAAVDQAAMDEQVHGALASGDLTVEELNELTLHFAVYCGWPRASQLEMTVRGQWQRVHEERGEETPAFPMRSHDELGPTDHGERIAGGVDSFREVNLIDPPAQDSPYFHAGIINYVFGHVWQRPGLTRRERRLVTIPCVGVSDAIGPIWSHVTSALGSGDVSYEEMGEIIAQFRAYAGEPRAQLLEDVATQWQAARS